MSAVEPNVAHAAPTATTTAEPAMAGAVSTEPVTTETTELTETTLAPTAPTATAAVDEPSLVPGPKVAAPPSLMLRNIALDLLVLPTHPSLSNENDKAGNPSLEAFMAALIANALQYIDGDMPKSWTSGGTKKSKPCMAEVKIYKWDNPKAAGQWTIRKSTHANVKDHGTFTWEEMDEGLRVDHSLKEKEYTDDIFDVFQVCRWDTTGVVVEGCQDLDMRIVEVAHKLPSPLSPRAFAELVVSAKTGPDGLVVVQVPVDLKSLPGAMYSNGRNKKDGTMYTTRAQVELG